MRKFVLTIAGLDPSGGAGLTADIKTFEQHKVYGLSVCTAITVQTEDVFFAIRWEKSKDVLGTLKVLLEKYDVAIIKTGIMRSLDYFSEIINWLWVNHPTIKIVVDPVFKSSTGFDFMTKINKEKLYMVLQKCYLVTPNIAEVSLMTGINDSFEGAIEIAKYCNIYLKGGHSKKNLGVDYLFLNDQSDKKIFTYNPKNISITTKHGSGCILSAAIVANLAIGFTIEEACGLAKVYIEKILTSNNTLLAYHKNE